MPCRPALILAGLIWTASAASGGPVLYLRPTAVLPAGGLSLGAIADVRSEDPREAAGLAALGLGAVPARAAFLPPQEVRRRVERSWAGRVDVVGAGVALLPEAAVPAASRAQAGAVLHALGRAGLGWVEVDLLSPCRPQLARRASSPPSRRAGCR